MPAIFPVVLSVVSTGSLQCMHGGLYTGEASTTTTVEGEAVATTKAGFADKTVCPGEPSVAPPCKFVAPATSMSVRVTVDTIAIKPVTVMIPQISSSNGRPMFIPIAKSVSTLVL